VHNGRARKMSTVAELKKKFGGQAKVALTPEQHAAALRQRERDQAEAIRVAKVRAPWLCAHSQRATRRQARAARCVFSTEQRSSARADVPWADTI